MKIIKIRARIGGQVKVEERESGNTQRFQEDFGFWILDFGFFFFSLS